MRLTGFLPRPFRFFTCMAALVGLPSCLDTATAPCTDYCDYICSCHPDDGDVTCNDCRTIYSDDDASLQDECETSLTDLQNADAAAGTDCPTDTVGS